jgi:dethiobiotin synthase
MTTARRALFVTGTDTEIGKTYVSRLLADAFAALGDTVTYCKPVQTGCEPQEDGSLVAQDFSYVMEGAASRPGSAEDHVPYRFEPACSPHLAAAMAHQTIDPDRIVRSVEKVSAMADITIVEGAGGIYVPLGKGLFMFDLMIRLEAPVVLVTSLKLGTLNHTFLSLSELTSRGLTVAGVVLNNAGNARESFIANDNRTTIAEFIADTPLLEVAHGAGVDDRAKEFCHEIKLRFLP